MKTAALRNLAILILSCSLPVQHSLADITIGGVDYLVPDTTESVTVDFAEPDGGVTVGAYSGLVLLNVSGVGEARGSRLNDAFYVYTDRRHKPTTPANVTVYFQLRLDDEPLVPKARSPYKAAKLFAVYDMATGTEVPPPHVPAYRDDHTYSFVANLYLAGIAAPSRLHFGVADADFKTNSGAYEIEVVQLQPGNEQLKEILARLETLADGQDALKTGQLEGAAALAELHGDVEQLPALLTDCQTAIVNAIVEATQSLRDGQLVIEGKLDLLSATLALVLSLLEDTAWEDEITGLLEDIADFLADGPPIDPPPGGDTVEMVSIAAVTFPMGRPEGESGEVDEIPLRDVTLSDYQIGKFEITNEQYAEVLNWALSQGYLETSGGGFYDGGNVYKGGELLLEITNEQCQISYAESAFGPNTRDGLPMADHPVVFVSWYGAAAFCNWLSEQEELAPCYDLATWEAIDADPESAGIQFPDGYHLPTEAEWEHAAAWDGETHWAYGFISDVLEGRERCNYNTPVGSWPASLVNPLGLSAFPYTAPVGWFDGTNVSPNGPVDTTDSPSPAGCYDMSGNVYEWCHDRYQWDYYAEGETIDPTGPSEDGYRVLRGGSWSYDAPNCRTADRYRNVPSVRTNEYGFRVCR